MCLAIPGKLIERGERTGRVDFGGLVRGVSLDLLPDAACGDVVLVHAGFAIQKVDLSMEPEMAERLNV